MAFPVDWSYEISGHGETLYDQISTPQVVLGTVPPNFPGLYQSFLWS